VLRHVLERFDCSGTPLAAEVVALFPPPLAVSWADLLPPLPTPEPEPETAPETEPSATPARPAPLRGRGGHLLDEARKLGLTPLRPAPSVSATGRVVVVTRADGARLECFRFQPFQTRRGIDTVVGLRFGYDAALIAALKDLLRQWRDAVRQANPIAQTAGGWLPAYRCWFVEVPAWPAVAALLRQHGYPAPNTP
jgi:hypothetical protein